MQIPYGLADFYSLRKEGQLYVDRTQYIPIVEALGRQLLFLRPRRFGKSLWLSTMANYYDFRNATEHADLFAGLAMERPTPLAHSYFVLHWDFSIIDPNSPFGEGSRVQRIGAEIHRYLNNTVKTFVSDFRDHLAQPVDLESDAFSTLENLLAAIRQTPYRLYLLIDEYDNFANEVLAADSDAYEELVTTDGPFKRLFKWVKAAMAGKGIDRLFITGVSPLVLSDITSGMNVTESITLYRELNALCGFTEEEVEDLLQELHAERDKPPWSVAETLDMLCTWYNGYRFSANATEAVYNPTLVLYFLKHLQRTDNYPERILDANLSADEGKLGYLAHATAGQDAVINLIREERPLAIRQLLDSFTLRSLMQRSSQDASFLGSYLFYFGMLTLSPGETTPPPHELVIPNKAVQGLYMERLREMLMPLGTSRTLADNTVFTFFGDGQLEPLLDFIEKDLFPTFSNRDATWANELTIKTIFLTLLWNEATYITHSEPELEHRYADLCLLRRPDVTDTVPDLLFEFKRLPLRDLGMSGHEIRDMSRTKLLQLKAVKKALEQAEEQLEAYQSALERRHGHSLKLRSYAVLALGFERLVTRRLEPS